MSLKKMRKERLDVFGAGGGVVGEEGGGMVKQAKGRGTNTFFNNITIPTREKNKKRRIKPWLCYFFVLLLFVCFFCLCRGNEILFPSFLVFIFGGGSKCAFTTPIFHFLRVFEKTKPKMKKINERYRCGCRCRCCCCVSDAYSRLPFSLTVFENDVDNFFVFIRRR